METIPSLQLAIQYRRSSYVASDQLPMKNLIRFNLLLIGFLGYGLFVWSSMPPVNRFLNTVNNN